MYIIYIVYSNKEIPLCLFRICLLVFFVAFLVMPIIRGCKQCILFVNATSVTETTISVSVHSLSLSISLSLSLSLSLSTGSASVEQRGASQGKPPFKVTRHTPRNVSTQRPYRMRTISSPTDQSQTKKRKLDSRNVSIAAWQQGTCYYMYKNIT